MNEAAVLSPLLRAVLSTPLRVQPLGHRHSAAAAAVMLQEGYQLLKHSSERLSMHFTCLYEL